MMKSLLNPLVALRNRADRGRALPKRADEIAVPASAAGVQSGSNPYVEARREWNERYGEYIHQAHQWRLMALISASAAFVAIVGVVYIGAQNKVVPYVVEVDKLGSAAAVKRADTATAPDARVVKAYLARFVSEWRAVTIDRQVQRASIDHVYAMLPSGSVGLAKLNEYYKNRNPFTAGAKHTVAVSVTNILQISGQTWQVEWQEVSRNLRGELESTTGMKASVIVGIAPPTDERMILANPLGVYITDLNWSQQL